MKQVCGWWLPDNDEHFEYHLTRGPVVHERATYQYAKIDKAMNVIPENRYRLAIDVGAHVGFWSYQLAHWFEGVIAFEPIPTTAECFLKNMNTSGNVELMQVALSDEEGRLPFAVCIENSGNSCVVKTDADADSINDAFRLDQYKFSDVDFLKIDVEGWEFKILLGAERTIRDSRPIVLVEQKPGHGARYGFDDRAAVKLLKDWGMRVLWEKSGDICLGW